VQDVLRTGRVTFADVEADDIQELSANVARKRIANPRVGDVIAIPARRGGYHMAVVVARNRFGTAPGLFNGTSAHGRLTEELHQSPRRFQVYTDNDQVKRASGRSSGTTTVCSPCSPRFATGPAHGMESTPASSVPRNPPAPPRCA
jgi:hypothetical protein